MGEWPSTGYEVRNHTFAEVICTYISKGMNCTVLCRSSKKSEQQVKFSSVDFSFETLINMASVEDLDLPNQIRFPNRYSLLIFFSVNVTEVSRRNGITISFLFFPLPHLTSEDHFTVV